MKAFFPHRLILIRFGKSSSRQVIRLEHLNNSDLKGGFFDECGNVWKTVNALLSVFKF
jgi:hypothetical protein